MDPDMTHGFDMIKISPQQAADAALIGLEANKEEVLVEKLSEDLRGKANLPRRHHSADGITVMGIPVVRPICPQRPLLLKAFARSMGSTTPRSRQEPTLGTNF
jgi:hypothetical protein